MFDGMVDELKLMMLCSDVSWLFRLHRIFQLSLVTIFKIDAFAFGRVSHYVKMLLECSISHYLSRAFAETFSFKAGESFCGFCFGLNMYCFEFEDRVALVFLSQCIQWKYLSETTIYAHHNQIANHLLKFNDKGQINLRNSYSFYLCCRHQVVRKLNDRTANYSPMKGINFKCNCSEIIKCRLCVVCRSLLPVPMCTPAMRTYAMSLYRYNPAISYVHAEYTHISSHTPSHLQWKNF